MMGFTAPPGMGSGMSALRARGGRSMRALGSDEDRLRNNEEVMAAAKTPEDLERIHMSPEGYMYLTERPRLSESLGMMSATSEPRIIAGTKGPSRLGGAVGDQRTKHMLQQGVELGPVWNEMEDLRRGRKATGYGDANYSPTAGRQEAAEHGANMAARFMAANPPQLSAAGQQNLENQYGEQLQRGGVDVGKMQMTTGGAAGTLGNWTELDPRHFMYNTDNAASLSRRGRTTGVGGTAGIRSPGGFGR